MALWRATEDDLIYFQCNCRAGRAPPDTEMRQFVQTFRVGNFRKTLTTRLFQTGPTNERLARPLLSLVVKGDDVSPACRDVTLLGGRAGIEAVPVASQGRECCLLLLTGADKG